MKKIFFIVVLFFIFSLNGISDLVPRWNIGRFGDNLLAFSNAAWLGYKNKNVRLCYSPFHYSSFLVASSALVLPKKEDEYRKIVNLPRSFNGKISLEDNVLYKSSWDYDINFAPVDWHDKTFLNFLRAMISPKEYSALQVPCVDLTIAIHIRRGGGYYFDTSQLQNRDRYHFPAISYYVKQLKKIIMLYPNQTMYVHIFTDDASPGVLKEVFEQEFSSNKLITFGCRIKNNKHDSNVLQDFFDMMQCDMLIRPRAHYSLFAERLGFFKLVICPDTKYFRPKNPISRVLMRRYNRQRYLVGPIFI